MIDDTCADGSERCFCEGESPEWEYHHPTGCADTAQAFRMVAEASTVEAWDEPRPLHTDNGRSGGNG